MRKHHLPIRVYYNETDAGGVVHHSSYLKYFEQGRTEDLRDIGLELLSLFSEFDVQFAVYTADLEFLRPAKLDQLLYVVTEVAELRSASIRYYQGIHLESPNGTLLCKANIR